MVRIILHIWIEILRMGSFLNVYFNYIKLILGLGLSQFLVFMYTLIFSNHNQRRFWVEKRKFWGHTWLQEDNLPNPGLVIVGKELC